MRCVLLLSCLMQIVGLADAAVEVERGRILTRSYFFQQADRQMEYTLYVPNGYDEQQKYPLVVALHALASNPQQIIRYPGLIQEAEKHGYLVVAPMGYNRYGWYGSRGTGGSRGIDRTDLGALSEKDVLNVLAIVRREFQIDPARIYLMGHSMGGSGAWHLATKFPDIWAAIAPLAPATLQSPDSLIKARHIPVIVVQGSRDKLVYSTRRWVAKMRELKMVHRYIEVEGGGHVRIAFGHFAEIFEFFNTHTRRTGPDTEPPKGDTPLQSPQKTD